MSKRQIRRKNVNNFGSISGEGGVHKAIQEAIKQRNKNPWVLKTDISSFFDKIDRSDLLKHLEKKLKNSSMMPLLEMVINCEISTQSPREKKLLLDNGIIVNKGLRQGMPLSPILSSFVLKPFDSLMIKNNFNIVRYVDDIIVFCDSEEQCHFQLKIIEDALEKIKHTIPSLHTVDSKTVIKSPADSITFLGIEIYMLRESIYSSKIPDTTIDEILRETKCYGNYEYVVNENLTYIETVKKLDEKQQGYHTAYKDTTNFKIFIQQLEHVKSEAKNNLLSSILGDELLKTLNKEQKVFLGLI